MDSWERYFAIFLGSIVGGILLLIRSKTLHFQALSKRRKLFVQFGCQLAGMASVMVPYTIWDLSGFQTRDARAAEQMMKRRYIEGGAQKAEVNFIITGHSSMTGSATVTYPDGSVVVAKCHSDLGKRSEYLSFCS